MWNLPKPGLDLSINDLEGILAHSRLFRQSHKAAVMELYRNYDGSGGSVTDEQHNTIPYTARRGLFRAYEKTYGSDHHRNIREALQDGVDKCPMCDIGNADTLDHYMEKSEYQALAIMRQNLVPMCFSCNNTRRTTGLRHTDMLHAYYDNLPPDRQWLKAALTFKAGALAASFYPDATVLSDNNLYTKAEKTIEGLKLDEAIRKELTSFLSSLLHGKGRDIEVLRNIMIQKANDLETNPMFGKNHWKTVLLKSIVATPGLTAGHLYTYTK